MESLSSCVPIQKVGWLDAQCYRDMPERQNCYILFSTLHGAHVRAIHVHQSGKRRLAKPSLLPVMLEISAKNRADVHLSTRPHRVLRCDALKYATHLAAQAACKTAASWKKVRTRREERHEDT
jgi:hypothetical protein